MKSCARISLFVLAAAILAIPADALAPHAGMLRYPDVSASHIAFLYANDLWLVPREGGVASPLASPPGPETYPKFSPDGSVLAFMGNYDGDTDLYTIPVEGGLPQRVTHHPATEVLTGWTPDGRLIFSANGLGIYPRTRELFTVSADGGLPVQLPVPYGAVGAISADGRWLAYTPHTRDQRTWKRYRGGMATDIWLFDLENLTSKKITDWEGTDTLPMWQDSRVYYLSDAGAAHRLDIWVYDTQDESRRQVTSFSDYDAKWPSIGPGPDGQGEIVFQHGSDLVLLDLATEELRTIEVVIPGDRPRLREQAVEVGDLARAQSISSTGKRAVVEARGDIWTIPAEHGSPVNLTRTDGAAEHSPVWSGDGRWIAYISDATGEYELYVVPSDGSGEGRRLTDRKLRYLYNLAWSPDSKLIAFWDQSSTLWISTLDGNLTEVHRDEGSGGSRVSWSPDSNWLAFVASDSLRQPNRIHLYDVGKAESHRVTAGMFNDTWPTFDRDGEFLYFASQREFSEPIYEDLGTTWVYAELDRLYAVPLRADAASPLAPKLDQEEWNGSEGDDESETDDATAGKTKKAKKKDSKSDDAEDDEPEKRPEPVVIDLEGFERRAVALPADRGNFGSLAVNDAGQLLYARAPGNELLGDAAIQLLDLEDDEAPEKTVLSGPDRFDISADGKKILAIQDQQMAIVDAKADQTMKPLATSGMRSTIDPRAEWRQIFHEAWRHQRDFFYDPNMHGVDWEAVRRQYEPLLEDSASRDDVTFVIQEMISELNVGHAYYRPDTADQVPAVTVGLLGADFELDNGAYRIKRILEGGAWDVDARGPLSQPGVGIAAGDYVLAVNGSPVEASKDPWASFQGLGGSTVTLTVSDKPSIDDSARKVVLELLGSERDLRYRSWVEANRAYVADKSGGRVGYIYVPNTGSSGQDELVRQFYGQLHMDALIIDERWNGGGQVPTRFIELLDRPVANYWSQREGEDIVWPPDAHHGPKCMLINNLAGSGGDYFPFWFRARGLGKLIGTRTWGGLVGYSGTPPLIDGTRITAPDFAFYETDGTWGIEGHGVDPDIEVIDDPAAMVGGKDPQLDAAIAHMLEELETKAYRPPTPPAFPNRSGMGIPPEDM